jgi:hypothetical protein
VRMLGLWGIRYLNERLGVEWIKLPPWLAQVTSFWGTPKQAQVLAACHWDPAAMDTDTTLRYLLLFNEEDKKIPLLQYAISKSLHCTYTW